jgi:hypothetical protein
MALTLTDHAAKGLDLAICEGHHRIQTEETCQFDLISRALVFRFRQKQACRAESGQGGGSALVIALGVKGRRSYLLEFESGARLPPQSADIPLHRPPRRPVALGHELPPELLGVPTAGVPPPSQVRGEGRDEGLPAVPRPLPFGGWGMARYLYTVGRLTWSCRAMAATPRCWACNRWIWW